MMKRCMWPGSHFVRCNNLKSGFAEVALQSFSGPTLKITRDGVILKRSMSGHKQPASRLQQSEAFSKIHSVITIREERTIRRKIGSVIQNPDPVVTSYCSYSKQQIRQMQVCILSRPWIQPLADIVQFLCVQLMADSGRALQNVRACPADVPCSGVNAASSQLSLIISV
jgi:hypothetical protein